MLTLRDMKRTATGTDRAVKKRRGPGAIKGKTQHSPHVCSVKCNHTCGQAGGQTKKGRPCTRPGGWGIPGVTHGHRRLCVDHDSDLGLKQQKEYAFDGDLVGKQVLFVIEYCGRANSNATQAAQNAGYGGSRASLQVIGSKLLKQPKIKAAIQARFDELGATGAEIIKRMTEDARLDISGLIKFEGKGKARRAFIDLTTPEILEKYGRLIKEIIVDPETGTIVRVKLNDSQAARRDLARIRRLLSDSPTVNIVIQLQELSDDEITEQLVTARQRLRAPVARFEEGNGQ